MESSKTRGLGTYVGAGLLVAVPLAIYYLYPIRVLVLGALLTLLFAVVLAAPIDYLARRGLRRGWGFLAVIGVLFLAFQPVQVAAAPLVSQARQLARDVPALLAEIQALVEGLPFGLGGFLAPLLDPDRVTGFFGEIEPLDGDGPRLELVRRQCALARDSSHPDGRLCCSVSGAAGGRLRRPVPGGWTPAGPRDPGGDVQDRPEVVRRAAGGHGDRGGALLARALVPRRAVRGAAGRPRRYLGLRPVRRLRGLADPPSAPGAGRRPDNGLVGGRGLPRDPADRDRLDLPAADEPGGLLAPCSRGLRPLRLGPDLGARWPRARYPARGGLARPHPPAVGGEDGPGWRGPRLTTQARAGTRTQTRAPAPHLRPNLWRRLQAPVRARRHRAPGHIVRGHSRPISGNTILRQQATEPWARPGAKCAAPVARVLREENLVSGFRVITTPRHTLEHASLLRDADGLLFTGDAFGILYRKFRVGVLKPFCADPPLAKRSAQKLLGQEFATVMFAHGPVLRSSGKAALRDAVDRCGY